MTTEAEIEVMPLQAKGCQGLTCPIRSEKKAKDSIQGLRGSRDLLIPWIQTSSLQNYKNILSFWYIIMEAVGNQYHFPNSPEPLSFFSLCKMPYLYHWYAFIMFYLLSQLFLSLIPSCTHLILCTFSMIIKWVNLSENVLWTAKLQYNSWVVLCLLIWTLSHSVICSVHIYQVPTTECQAWLQVKWIPCMEFINKVNSSRRFKQSAVMENNWGHLL